MARILAGMVVGMTLLSGSVFAAVDAVKVTTDKTVDGSSLESIVSDVIRLSGAKSNDEKAIAIYDYLHSVMFHLRYAAEGNRQTIGPLKLMHVYGWALCGGEHTTLKSLFETAGWQVRYRGWSDPGHTTIETLYDGKWHYLDVFLKCYYWSKDRTTIVGQDEINADPSIVLEGLKDGRVPKNSYACCGDDPKDVVSGCKTSVSGMGIKHDLKPEDSWDPSKVTGRDIKYSPLLTLCSGEALRLEWTNMPGMMVSSSKFNIGKHKCGNKDFRSDPVLGPRLEHYGTRAYANGRIVYAPDFSKAADVADVVIANAKAEGGKLVAAGAGSAIFTLNLPYPYALCTAKPVFEGGDGKLFVSSDGGKTWSDTAGEKPALADIDLKTPSPYGEIRGFQEAIKTAISATNDVTLFVRQKYNVSFKVEFPATLAKFSVEGIVEHNRHMQPYLVTGKNAVTISAKDNKIPPDSVLVVTYAYQEATAKEGRTKFDGTGITYGAPKTVVKEISKTPFTFDIDVGGNTPPKMLYIERALKAR